MRFAVVRMRNTDPSIPALWMDYPMMLLEPEVCSAQEEYDRWEGLPYQEEWDERHDSLLG